ncbi:epoxide hydrolase [Talaromyces proteolyticus]|uniref:Epoxide hydrolase n=1 Tax=Talaromyces proteolyticus TaxID=1131652 RepID=A0AAD4KMC4_9EURO|nr:epoxide hydrolase [Talaromyces proteolyticus]KAH8693620.1 epoxide hydrolase [Talaromyces proteolyticus]
MASAVGIGSSTIRPFKISVTDEQLVALRQKLALTSFPDEVDRDQPEEWSMGAPLGDIKRLTQYWKDSFDWRSAERELNETLPQFVTTVPVSGFGELDIHFVYKQSKTQRKRKAIPLLFLHGWPGSFIEVKKVLPLLTEVGEGDEDLPVFDVVAPSLPNFGFSEGPAKKGFGLAQYAESMHAVMMALGYPNYVVQGGDWGSFIARAMGTLYPNHVKAIHLNFIAITPPYPWRNPLLFLRTLFTFPFSRDQKLKIAVTQNYIGEGNGYAKQQDTRPQTLGYSLSDSPVGLLAWIYDKLHTWTDSYPWTDDEILQWVSIYAFSRAGPAASLRIYYESMHPLKSDPANLSRDEVISRPLPSSVKVAMANFPKEILQFPTSWIQAAGNVVRETDYDKGGHFAAWEVPELLVQDVKAFLAKSGAGYGAVSGQDGY